MTIRADIESVASDIELPVHFDRHDQCAKVRVLDISQMLAEAIKRIHLEQSISSLFIQ